MVIMDDWLAVSSIHLSKNGVINSVSLSDDSLPYRLSL